jgi:hypothetical protein
MADTAMRAQVKAKIEALPVRESKNYDPLREQFQALVRMSQRRMVSLLSQREQEGMPDLAAGEKVHALIARTTGATAGSIADLLRVAGGEQYIRAHLRHQARVFLERCSGNTPFLDRMITAQVEHLPLRQGVLDTLFALHQSVFIDHGEDQAAGVYFLFLLTGNLDLTREIVACQKPSEPQGNVPGFFPELLACIRYHAEIFERLSTSDDREKERGVYDLAAFLRSVFGSSALKLNQPPVLRFSAIAAERIRSRDSRNPFFREEHRHAPFDGRRLAALVEQQLPPAVLASMIGRIQRSEEREEFDESGKSKQEVAEELALLLVTLRARLIVEDPQAQEQFWEIYRRLGRLRVPSSEGLADLLHKTLKEHDAFLNIPLEACTRHPQHRGKTLRELLELFTARVFPERRAKRGARDPSSVKGWSQIIPTLTLTDLRLNGVDALRRDFSGAIEPPYKDRFDLREQAEVMKVAWGDKKFDRAFALLQRELEETLGVGADTHAMILHKGAAELFGYLMDRLRVMRLPGNAVITSQEYSTMVERKIGAGTNLLRPRVVPRNDASGKPLSWSAFLDQVLAVTNKNTRCAVLSVVSRYGHTLFGSSSDPASELEKFLQEFRAHHPKPIVILDQSQAIGRIPLLSLKNVDDRTILLGSAGKMLGVRELGFAVVPEALAASMRPIESDEQGPKALLPADSLSTAGMLVLSQRLRELRSPYRRPDILSSRRPESSAQPSDTKPYPAQQRIYDTMRLLTQYAVSRAQTYGESLYPFVQKHPGFVGRTKKEAIELLGCRVFGPIHHHENARAGILSLSFPTLPAEYVAAQLAKRKFQTSGVRMGHTCLRIAFHEFHSEQDIDELFAAIAAIHLEYLAPQKRLEVAEHYPEDEELARMK